MSIYIGSDKIRDVYVGSDKIGKIYVGSDLVYEAASLPPGYTDTGLGWAAKTEFLVYDANTLLSTSVEDSSLNYYKSNDGWAIVVGIVGPSNATSGPIAISTTETFTYMTRGGNNYNAIHNLNGYLGRNWRMNNNIRSATVDKNYPSGIQTITYATTPGYATVFQDAMTAAGVIIL